MPTAFEEYAERMRKLGPHPSWQVTPPASHQTMLAEDEGDEEHGRFDQPGEVSPQGHSIQYHGGPVLTDGRLVVIWAGEKDLDKQKFALFAKDLMENGYFDALTPYLNNQQFKGSFWGAVDGPTVSKTPFTQTDAANYVGSCVASGLVPQPDGKTQYSIMLPPGVQAQLDNEYSCGPNTPMTFCAYHFSPDGKTLIDVEADPTCGGCVGSNDQFSAACMLLSHETCETISDPFGTGWYEDKTGMENSDIVAWIRLAFGPTAEGNTWAVQGYFGNEGGGSNLVGKYRAPVAQQPPPNQPPPNQPPPAGKTVHQLVIDIDNQMLADYAAHKITYAEAVVAYTYLRQVFDQLPAGVAPRAELSHPREARQR